MNVFKYFKESYRRKIARRFTRTYPAIVNKFNLEKDGIVEFANWDNPLIRPYELNQGMVDFFRKFIKPGDLAIDIGANIGDTTVPMALAAGGKGLVLGFDPSPLVFKVLEVNATLNKGKQNIVPHQFAISTEEDEFYYVSSEASFSNGAISKTRKSPHGKFVYPEKIKGVNLKKFLEASYSDKIGSFSFIKIDTEGYDKEIIKSISDLLKVYKPVIVAESFGEASVEAKMELYNVIEVLGYNIYYFEDFDIKAKTVKLEKSSDLAAYKETVNIYAVPK